MPGFLERDEGEREPPVEKYPWDGVSGAKALPRLCLVYDRWGVLKLTIDDVRLTIVTERPFVNRQLSIRKLSDMLHLPVIRWGEPYDSMEVDEVVHFSTGEPIAKVSRARTAD